VFTRMLQRGELPEDWGSLQRELVERGRQPPRGKYKLPGVSR